MREDLICLLFLCVQSDEDRFLKVYEVERVLVECLRPVHQVDLQIIAPEFKKYFQQNQIHLHKLFYYAQLFKVTDKLQSYTEVLS